MDQCLCEGAYGFVENDGERTQGLSVECPDGTSFAVVGDREDALDGAQEVLRQKGCNMTLKE